jgi:hypothetical protein
LVEHGFAVRFSESGTKVIMDFAEDSEAVFEPRCVEGWGEGFGEDKAEGECVVAVGEVFAGDPFVYGEGVVEEKVFFVYVVVVVCCVSVLV